MEEGIYDIVDSHQDITTAEAPFPDDCLRVIFSYLPVRSVFCQALVLSKVIRRWLWRDVEFWREVFRRHIPREQEWEFIMMQIRIGYDYDWHRIWVYVQCVVLMENEPYENTLSSFFRGKLHNEFGMPAQTHDNGYMAFYQRGELHRIGGPAVIKPNGEKQWWVNGHRHREDGPALECAKLTAWYLHGRKHRTGGKPAVIRRAPDRIYREWYIHGEKVTVTAAELHGCCMIL